MTLLSFPFKSLTWGSYFLKSHAFHLDTRTILPGTFFYSPPVPYSITRFTYQILFSHLRYLLFLHYPPHFPGTFSHPLHLYLISSPMSPTRYPSPSTRPTTYYITLLTYQVPFCIHFTYLITSPPSMSDTYVPFPILFINFTGTVLHHPRHLPGTFFCPLKNLLLPLSCVPNSLFNQMERAGLTPDVWTYNSLANVLGSCGEWERALGLLDDMRVRGLTPDVITYSALVSACQKAGQVCMK